MCGGEEGGGGGAPAVGAPPQTPLEAWKRGDRSSWCATLLTENSFMPSGLAGVECLNVCEGEDSGAVEAGHHFYELTAWKLQGYHVCQAESGISTYLGIQLLLYAAGACGINSGAFGCVTDKDCLCRTRGKYV